MVTKIIQAVAGAGKTYHITHNFGNNQRCLYLTYTNGNVKNLKRELALSNKNSENYLVSIFSKFIIDWLINPFFNELKPNFPSFKGFTTVKPVSDSRLPSYVKKEYPGHYMNKYGSFYLNRISELINYQPNKIIEKMFKRISCFVDTIIIDEYQDFTGNDFNLIKKITKQKHFSVLLVGDVFQAAVVNSLSSGKKDSKVAKYQFNENLDDFLKTLFGSKKIIIDTTSLNKSRRISKDCANFVTSKLGISIDSKEISKGKLHIIQNNDALKELLDSHSHHELNILIYDSRVRHNYNSNNHKYITWTYSKGDTYNDVLVVSIGSTDFVLTDNQPKQQLNNATRNKFYVALTRACGELYIVNSKLWKNFF